MVLCEGCAAELMMFGTRATVMLTGDLDERSAPKIRSYLDRVLLLCPRTVTLTLDRLRTCDPSGMALLGEYRGRAAREGWTFRLRAASRIVLAAAEQAGLGDVLA
ncbi:MAG: STAS domain-containing protein [Actinobacteria bacterium]|nr:STAS domain-containing protein [Actinomycetota bacterium]